MDANSCSAQSLLSIESYGNGLSLSSIFIGSIIGLLGLSLVYLVGLRGREPKKPCFQNNVSAWFWIYLVVIEGASFQALVKFMSSCTRRRLYVGLKRFLFFGQEGWWVGHPALLKHIFSPKNAHLWYKLDKKSVNEFFFIKNTPNNAMLYSGDDDNWKHARMALTPYFMTSNFEKIDELADAVVEKHLLRLLECRDGRAELLELMLFITVDLLCEVLYGVHLPEDELAILVESLTEYTVPGSFHRGKYPGGHTALTYHRKVAKEIADNAPKNTLAHMLLNDCPSIPDSLKYENCAFFLEALTPAFAGFWTISSICLTSGTNRDIKKKCLENPIYRQQCIKEALRMYPPVPALWPRAAKKTHTFANPLYEPRVSSSRSLFSNLFGSSDIRTQKTITIKEGTLMFALPSSFHYDDRFWMNADEYIPARWDKDPYLVHESKVASRKQRESRFAALNLRKGEEIDKKIDSHLDRLSKPNESTTQSVYDNKSQPLRYKIFGPKNDMDTELANLEHLSAALQADELAEWTFLPFGLGKHTCLGRRLAVRLVDAIVGQALSYDINFENGVVPGLFKQPWTERLNAVSGVYNYPADPVYIEIESYKQAPSRELRQSSLRQGKSKVYRPTVVLPIMEGFESGTKCALLLIDCRNEYLDPKGKLYGKVESVMESLGTKIQIRTLVEEIRKINGALVIHASTDKTTVNESSTDTTTWDKQLPSDMGFTNDDIVLVGTGADCCEGSALSKILEENEIDTLFIAGFLSDVGIKETVSSLAELHLCDLYPISDACAAESMEAHDEVFRDALEKDANTITADVALSMLEEMQDLL